MPFEKLFILLHSLIRSLYNLFSPDNAVDGRKLGIFFFSFPFYISYVLIQWSFIRANLLQFTNKASWHVFV